MKNFKNFLKEDTTLEYHNELNPKLFDENGRLFNDVRLKLLQFAYTWIEFSKVIPKDIVKDVFMTGGNVNYNYTPYSDIDVHVEIDKSKTPNKEMFDSLLDDKKQLWTLKHHDVKVKGYPLEPYAHDVNEKLPNGQGAYSLLYDKWIQKPEHGNYDFKHDSKVEKKANFYERLINRMIEENKDAVEFDKILARIYTMRGDSISKNGEFAFGNLVFKELRNRGVFDRINDYRSKNLDKSLSLESKEV